MFFPIVVALAICLSVTTSVAQRPVFACNELKRTLGGAKVLSSGPQYNATAFGTWSSLNVNTPTCIVYAEQAEDVKHAMAVIFLRKVPYALRSGGHSPMVGWNNVDEGVLIDFSHMKAISYDKTTDTITLEPGVRWAEAVEYLEPFGVAPVGGRAGDVGTSLLLGGGLSYLSPALGYACDSFKAVDVVLVDGILVTATATNKHADLFKALKGGANRFGIVTKYQLYPARTGTREEKSWFGGTVVYPTSSTDALLGATSNYVKNTRDPNAVAGILFNAGSPDQAVHVAFMFYKGPELPSEIFGDLVAVPSIQSSLSAMSYYDVTVFGGPGGDYGYGQQNAGSALIEKEEFKAALEHYQNYTTTFAEHIVSAWMIVTPVTTSQIDAGKARGGNIIGGTRAHGSIAFSDTYTQGMTELPDDVKRGRRLLMKQTPPLPGLPLFANEIDAAQDVFKTYAHFKELKQTYRKYDPSSFNVRHQQGPILTV